MLGLRRVHFALLSGRKEAHLQSPVVVNLHDSPCALAVGTNLGVHVGTRSNLSAPTSGFSCGVRRLV